MMHVNHIKLEINDFDNEAILAMYTAECRKNGYNRQVFVNANRLYEIHGIQARVITEMWLRVIEHSSKMVE